MRKSHSAITENLHVSDISTVREEQLPHPDVVVSVCQESTEPNVSCESAHFPLSDGEAVERYGGDDTYECYARAVDTVVTHLQDGKTVHVHCHHGQSRSVSVVTSALAVMRDISWGESLNLVSRAHERSSPDEQLVEYGKRYISEFRE